MSTKKITVGQSSIQLNNDPLLAIVQQIEGAEKAYVKVGIFGSKLSRTEPGANNPTIGAVHEFGSVSKGIPRRSFLRVPIIEYLPPAMVALGADHWEQLIFANGFMAALAQLGVLAVSVVQDAFATGGYGKWAALKRATIRRKKSSAILIDTGQLRRSVHFKVFAK
jgi:phage gpG-like protein